MYPVTRDALYGAWVGAFRRERLSTLVLLVVLPPVSGHWDGVGLSGCAFVPDRSAWGGGCGGRAG